VGADRRLLGLALLLIGGDAVVVLPQIEALMLEHARAGLGPLAERWLEAQVLLLATAAVALALRRAGAACALTAIVAVAVALLKLMKPHLALGAALAEAAALRGGLGLNPVETGKLVAELGLGGLCLAAAVIARRLADDIVGAHAALIALWLVAGLAVAGGAADLAGMAPSGHGRGAAAVLGLIEATGEMLVVSLGVLALVTLGRAATPACRPARPAAV
jgi:hypothetical protein